MANFEPIYEWVLRIEDPSLQGKVVNLMDGQGLTRFGVGQASHPDLPADFYTRPAQEALAIAAGIYRAQYWNGFMGDQILDDGVASCLLSFGINDGDNREIRLLQQVLGFTVQDGIMGPMTLAATNRMPPITLAAALRTAQANFYRMLVAKQPTDARFLNGWLRRASLVFPSLS
jgi:lysozyme family protein